MNTEPAMKKEMTQTKRLLQWLPVLCAMIFTLLLCWVKGKQIINSDFSAEMLLGRLLSEEGGILSEHWLYSTELRVIYHDLIYKYLFYLFPNDWHLVRFLATAILLLMMSAACGFMMYQAGLRKWIPVTLTILCLPFAQWYTANVLIGHSYFSYLIFKFLCIGLFLCTVRSLGKERWVYAAAGVVILFLFGLEGIRVLMIFSAPLFLSAVLYYIISDYRQYVGRGRNDQADKRNPGIRVFFIVLLFCIASAAGYLVNTFILSRYYYFELKGNEICVKFSLGQMLNLVSESFRLLGWQSDVKIISFEGITNCFSILIMLFIIFSVVRLIQNAKKLSEASLLLLLFIISDYLITLLFLSMNKRPGISYWLPFTPMFFVLMGMELETDELPYLRFRVLPVSALLIFSFFLCSVSVWRNPNTVEVETDPAANKVVDWLVSQGYERGYSEFWSGDVLTELSDGKLEMYVMGNMDRLDDLSQMSGRLQLKSHTTQYAEGPFFALYTKKDFALGDGAGDNIFALTDYLVYGDEDAYIYRFESMDEYIALMDALQGKKGASEEN